MRYKGNLTAISVYESPVTIYKDGNLTGKPMKESFYSPVKVHYVDDYCLGFEINYKKELVNLSLTFKQALTNPIKSNF